MTDDKLHAPIRTPAGDQITYWNGPGASKIFTHPVNQSWLADLDRHSLILDYGCGYGRTLTELSDLGFDNLHGADVSSALVDRARAACPDAQMTLLSDTPNVDLPEAAVDCIMLFAVLTCIHQDHAQKRLLAELVRLLRPGGLLYVSDMPLQDDDRNRERYKRFEKIYGCYGVFETEDGAICRHHSRAYLDDLVTPLVVEAEHLFTVTTMNGHTSNGVQLLLRRLADGASRTPQR